MQNISVDDYQQNLDFKAFNRYKLFEADTMKCSTLKTTIKTNGLRFEIVTESMMNNFGQKCRTFWLLTYEH